MPGTGDSPNGVHPHVQLEVVGNEVWLWVKGKVHAMSHIEAHALAESLGEHAKLASEANQPVPPPVQEPEPPPAEEPPAPPPADEPPADAHAA